jgi:30S ribosomal protein 3
MAEAQQLKLKVLWLKNVLGLALDQKVIKQSYPLTQYYFWPRTEAWDQLKLELDSKPWLSEKEKISTLNLATDIISHWRTNRNTDAVQKVANNFSEAVFVDLNC